MVSRQELNELLTQVNDILAKLDKRITQLEESAKAPKTTPVRKSTAKS